MPGWQDLHNKFQPSAVNHSYYPSFLGKEQYIQQQKQGFQIARFSFPSFSAGLVITNPPEGL
jgi:hypothetical protein